MQSLRRINSVFADAAGLIHAGCNFFIFHAARRIFPRNYFTRPDAGKTVIGTGKTKVFIVSVS